jgi:transcriptional regulator with XRE-family HTH domain
MEERMTEPEGQFTRRKMLGDVLRQLRGERKLREVAQFTGISESSVSRIENGKQKITAANVRLLCQCYGIGAPEVDMLMRQATESDDRASVVIDDDSVADWAKSFADLQHDSEETKTYQLKLIPGPLQTAAYARAVVAAGETDQVTADGVVRRRSAQRSRLLEGDWVYRAILDEAALRTIVGDRLVMAEQAEDLAEVAGLANVAVQIVPFEAGAHIAMTGPFTMLRYRGSEVVNAVFVELDHAVWSAEKPRDLDRYTRMYEQLTKTALSPDESRTWLVSLGKFYRANGGSSR